MKITWADQALRDLRSIHDFIARDSDHYAALVSRANHYPSGADQPHAHSGASRASGPKLKLREVHQHNYRIIYQHDDTQMHIITIVHMKQRLPKARLKAR